MKNRTYYQVRFILLFFITYSFLLPRLFSQCDPVGDSLMLVLLYNTTDGDNWIDNSNWLVEGQPISEWAGVEEVNEEGCVTVLDLSGNNLFGEIPSEIENLSNLINLSIGGSGVTGSIPAEIGNLSNLQKLSVGGEGLTGSIPPEIGNLTSLTSLVIIATSLTGEIPSEIGNLLDLEELTLNSNELTGGIPVELWNLEKMVTLSIQNTNLNGEIPLGMGDLPYLTELDLNNNELVGSIPSDIVDAPSLKFIHLINNNLSGSIPIGFGSMPLLTELHIGSNELTGTIPSDIGDASPYLYYINLSHNNLGGEIPEELGNFGGTYLYFNDNELTGKLPIQLSNTSLHTLSLENNQLYGCFPPQYAVFCSIAAIDFTGNDGLGDFNAFCEDGTGACSATLTGQITFDENKNCTTESSEPGLQNWKVKASSVSGDLYGISDSEGKYSIYTYSEEYTVEVIPPLSYWEESCTGIATVDVLDSLDLDTINFLPQALIECPLMTVDISTPFSRRCFGNTYVVNYCNNGTAIAEDVSIVIAFDELINIEGASVTISEQVGNILTFNLGNIGVNECNSFFIFANISCDSELGQTLCVRANIYPDSICEEVAPEWSGATVDIDGNCDGEEVIFIIKNTGEGDMLQNRTYIIVEDGLILMAEPEPFILNSNGDLEISYPANGSTYICQAMQVDNHPVSSMPIAFIEGCGTNDDGGFSTGYATQFPEDDNTPFVSTDCQEVIGSFDPNDKNGYPKGYSEEHFIERGQDINYHIRFQNTGTDTAFTVMIEDVLSSNLDIESLRLGASSHPYIIEIEGSSTLKFIFKNILLPDSTTNEPLSHGFIKFKISQKADLALSTTIENQAAIFFDFNEAVLTNKTLHTIGENFVQITAIEEPFITNLKVSLTPNPMVNEAIIRISGIDFKNAQLSLFNTLGMLLGEETFNGNEVTLRRGSLSTGIYFFEIIVDGQKGFTGRMVVE